MLYSLSLFSYHENLLMSHLNYFSARKKRRRRNKRFHQRTLSLDELLESPTFKKFASSIEYVFDTAEDVDFGSLDPSNYYKNLFFITTFNQIIC